MVPIVFTTRQVLPVLCCAAGVPHGAAVGQDAFNGGPVEVDGRVRGASLL